MTAGKPVEKAECYSLLAEERDCEGRGRRGGVGETKPSLGRCTLPWLRKGSLRGRQPVGEITHKAGRDLEVAVISRLSATNLK